MGDTVENILKVGTVLNDKWVILEFITKGGMGEVYRAHQVNLNRDVAIKVISPEWLQCSEGDEEEMEDFPQRLRREVQAMAQISHAHILQIFDYDSAMVEKGGETASIDYIAMEYVPGGTLRATMSEEGFCPDEDATRTWLLDYFIPVLEGVQAMHECKIIHRDLKPENVLMDGNIPKITDFGLARSCLWKPMTGSIDIKGTPAYMSPEHWFEFRKAGEQADIYSLGKMLYEAIDGKMGPETIPFKSACLAKAETPFFQKLGEIILEATAEDKKARYDSVEKFRLALLEVINTPKGKTASRITTPSAVRHSRWPWIAAAAASFLALLTVTWHFMEMPWKLPLSLKGPSADIQELARPHDLSSLKTAPSSPGSPVQSIKAKDGVTLRFVPGGKVILPENFGPESGKWAEVTPFYMDETEVTNHQYVEFLNQVLPQISVEKGVVQGEDTIWLLLGEAVEGYEPIVFQDGYFHITDPAHASCPVIRVTPYGAAAYAAFYGRRLPTDKEWLHAMKGGSGQPKGASGVGSDTSEKTGANAMMDGTHHPKQDQIKDRAPVSPEPSGVPTPVIVFEPNGYGIRGLNAGVKEWGMRMLKEPSGEKMEYVILGEDGSDSEKGDIISAPVSRYPWEAFEEVGFRCVLDASIRDK